MTMKVVSASEDDLLHKPFILVYRLSLSRIMRLISLVSMEEMVLPG